MTDRTIGEFDAVALYEALDAERVARGLSWKGVADSIWELSAELNEQRPTDHPISPATLTGMAKSGSTSCQHALFMLHWLERTPESFLRGIEQVRADATLPACDSSHRLRWNLKKTYAAMNERRQTEGLTWPELARILRCSPNQLTGLKTARFAMGMALAMRITQWLDEPAATFVRAARG